MTPFKFDPLKRVPDALEVANQLLEVLQKDDPEVGLAALVAAVAALSVDRALYGTPEEVWSELWRMHAWLFMDARFKALEHRQAEPRKEPT